MFSGVQKNVYNLKKRASKADKTFYFKTCLSSRFINLCKYIQLIFTPYIMVVK
jgi:hypothetical protein